MTAPSWPFLAMNCDDSAGDCPKFCQYFGHLVAHLLARELVALSTTQRLHDVYFEYHDEFGPPKQTKIRRFSQIVVSMLQCLNESSNDNVLQNVAHHIGQHIDRSHIDREVFIKKEAVSMYHLVSGQ